MFEAQNNLILALGTSTQLFHVVLINTNHIRRQFGADFVTMARLFRRQRWVLILVVFMYFLSICVFLYYVEESEQIMKVNEHTMIYMFQIHIFNNENATIMLIK